MPRNLIKCARMLCNRPGLYLALLILFSSFSVADVIHLKNGRVIVADSSSANKDKVQYTVGENIYAIPRSSVDRIDAGSPAAAIPAQGSTQASSNSPVSMQPSDRLNELERKQPNLFENGAVNQAMVQNIESTHDDQLIAQTYLLIALHEHEQGNSASAHLAFSNALAHADGLGRMDDIVQTLLVYHLEDEAIRFGEAYVRRSPDSASAYKWLGVAYFMSDRKADAVKALSRSVELHPDDEITPLLDRARRETNAQAGFREEGSSHFNMMFEGSATPDQLKKSILDALEQDYQDLSNDLQIAPHERIEVVLYTRKAFFDVTQAQDWTGAVYDGKLRIPVSGLSEMTPELGHVLRHELTHSFVSQISHGRCPFWLNEGAAMVEEPFSLGRQGTILAQYFRAGHDVPLNRLEGTFMGYSAPEATLAYEESFAAANYIRAQYGMNDIVRILKRLGQGEPIEAAMRQTIHMGYSDLQSAVGTQLTQQYPE